MEVVGCCSGLSERERQFIRALSDADKEKLASMILERSRAISAGGATASDVKDRILDRFVTFHHR